MLIKFPITIWQNIFLSAQFYMELYAHIDGSLRDLVRAKMIQLFNHGVRKAVGQKFADKSSRGLLDGQEAVTAKLQEANKADELISKVLFLYFLLIFEIIIFSFRIL